MRARALAAALLLSGPALPVSAEDAPAFNLSFGVDLTTNYISNGATETSNSPAVQP